MEYKCLPDLTSLATLKAVVELGGVAEAGAALHVGQPAATKRLRALEECYGMVLMQRKGRRLVLTDAGERVYAYACLVLDHQAALLDDLRTLADGENRLRLEVNFSIGEHLLPGLLLQFNDAYPQYTIKSRMGYARHIQTRLATGLADLALLEMAPDHPEILVQKWLDDELVLVCGCDHALAGGDPISVEQLRELQFVLREPQSAVRIDLDRAMSDIGIDQLKVAMEVGSNDTIVEMLERGTHVSFLPRFAVAEALAEDTLCHLRVKGLRIKRTLWIARTRSNLDNAVAEAFIQMLRGRV